MAHALSKYARHVQRELQTRLSEKPPYQWCLRMVQFYYDDVRDQTVGMRPRTQAIKEELAKRIVPVGALQLQAEGRFRNPPAKTTV